MPVDAADRDIDGLVLVHRADLLADGDFGGAAHHDPMLGAVPVLLQRQNAARDDDDALDLKALAHVDGLVIAPGPVHALVVGGLRRAWRP